MEISLKGRGTGENRIKRQVIFFVVDMNFCYSCDDDIENLTTKLNDNDLDKTDGALSLQKISLLTSS